MLFSVFTTIGFNLVFIIRSTGHNVVLFLKKYCINRCKAKKDMQYKNFIRIVSSPLTKAAFAEKKEKQVSSFSAHMAKVIEQNDRANKKKLGLETIAEHSSEYDVSQSPVTNK